MRNLEYHASNIVMEMILNPKKTIIIGNEELANMVRDMIKMIIKENL